MTHGHIVIDSLTDRDPYELYTYHDGHLSEAIKELANLPAELARREFLKVRYAAYLVKEHGPAFKYWEVPMYQSLALLGRSGGPSCTIRVDEWEKIERMAADPAYVATEIAAITFYEFTPQGIARLMTAQHPDRWFPVTSKERSYPGPDLRVVVTEEDDGRNRHNHLMYLRFTTNDPEYKKECRLLWNRAVTKSGFHCKPLKCYDSDTLCLKLDRFYEKAVHNEIVSLRDSMLA